MLFNSSIIQLDSQFSWQPQRELMTFERPFLWPGGALFRRLQPRSSQYRILSMAQTFQGGCTSSSFDPHMYLIRNHATAVTARLQARYLSASFTTAASSNSLWYILPFTNQVRYFLSNKFLSAVTYGSLYLYMEFRPGSLDSAMLFVFHTTFLQGQRIKVFHPWWKP